MKKHLKIALFLGIFALVLTGHAQEELYSERPDITQVEARVATYHNEAERVFHHKIQDAILEMVAMLSETYQGHDIYFIARDGEYLYDLAKLLLPNSENIHLINISRDSLDNDSNRLVKTYLAQKGITEQALEHGKKVLFVDTAYRGSIADHIKNLFPVEYRAQMPTQLINSHEERIPSFRSFLRHFHPMAVRSNIKSTDCYIDELETQLPHYTDRAHSYMRSNGALEAYSLIGAENDGMVSRERALRFMQNLKAYAQRSSTLQIFRSKRETWRNLNQLFDSAENNEILTANLSRFYQIAHNEEERLYREGMIRDLLRIKSLNFHQSRQVNYQSIGISSPMLTLNSNNSNLDLVLAYHPNWRRYLIHHARGIPLLLRRGETHLLYEMLLEIEDNHIFRSFFYELKNNHTQLDEALRELLVQLLNHKQSRLFSQAMIREFLTHPLASSMPELFDLMIDRIDAQLAKRMVLYVYPSGHTANLSSSLEKLIDRFLVSPSWKSEVLRPLIHTLAARSDSDPLLWKMINSRTGHLTTNEKEEMLNYFFSQIRTRENFNLERFLRSNPENIHRRYLSIIENHTGSRAFSQAIRAINQSSSSNRRNSCLSILGRLLVR